ncbi:hypothetical protein, partial [Hungatella hathewayi]|uniref:hypothetical protein n=1 Tax=Hungatella hathewayi TaxID=154046 RepID=UPI00321A539C
TPEGLRLRVHLKSGLEARFHLPFFPPFRLTSCEPRKRNPFAPASLPLSTSSEAVYWLWEGKIKGASLLEI